jgi:hypothetical protein
MAPWFESRPEDWHCKNALLSCTRKAGGFARVSEPPAKGRMAIREMIGLVPPDESVAHASSTPRIGLGEM